MLGADDDVDFLALTSERYDIDEAWFDSVIKLLGGGTIYKRVPSTLEERDQTIGVRLRISVYVEIVGDPVTDSDGTDELEGVRTRNDGLGIFEHASEDERIADERKEELIISGSEEVGGRHALVGADGHHLHSAHQVDVVQHGGIGDGNVTCVVAARVTRV